MRLSPRLLPSLALCVAPAALAGPTLSVETVPAADRAQATLTIDTFGRYAIQTHSEQGVALQLVDRMTGAGAIFGEAGAVDGRIDVILEAGTYQLRSFGHPESKGEARLSVTPFADLSPKPTRLVPAREEVTSLADLQERAWWLDLSAAQPVFLQAAGRHLADLRLWRDGSWLVDATPRCAPIRTVEARPLQQCTLSLPLEPGLYRVVASGGPGEVWTDGAKDTPLHLRLGLEAVGPEGHSQRTLGPTGVEQLAVPAGPNWFRVRLPERPAPGTPPLHVALSRGPNPGGGALSSQTLKEEARVPELVLTGSGEARVLTISGTPGQPYTLTWMAVSSGGALKPSAPTWYGTLHSENADTLPPTGFTVVRGKSPRVDASHALVLTPKHHFERRYDARGASNVYVEITERSTWKIAVSGVETDVSINPFFMDQPKGYVAMKPVRSTWSGELDPGRYEIKLAPVDPGIATLRIEPVPGALASLVGGRTEPLTPRPALQLGSLDPDPSADRALILSQAGGASAGLVSRLLPVNLEAALPVGLSPGETSEIPAVAPRPATLTASAHGGGPLPVSTDGLSWGYEVVVPAGPFTAWVRNDRPLPQLAQLGLLPTERAPKSPPPALDPARLSQLPRFERLTASRPTAGDLTKGVGATYGVLVENPGLYALESTGLLATEAALRTRTRTSFLNARANGPGRNFMFGAYLGTGDYQLTMRTVGNSAGHYGLRLRPTTLHEGGALADDQPARTTLPAGDAVVYTLQVDSPSRWTIRSVGPNGVYTCRIEDEAGFPLAAPTQPCDTTVTLDPGVWRVISLPEPVEGRRVTTATREPVRLTFTGHGPHALARTRLVGHTWREPEGDAPRLPDTWVFTLPAAGITRINAGGMAGRLVDSRGAEAAVLPPGTAWSGELAAGAWRLELLAPQRNDHLRYTLAVTTDALMAGDERSVPTSVTIPVAIGEAGPYVFESRGGVDVRASLWREGERVATNDDRANDWNFRLATLLSPGDYTLVLEPAGGRSGRVMVSLRRPTEETAAEATLGARLAVRPGAADLLVPLAVPPKTALISARARSGEWIALSLEGRVKGAWRTLSAHTGPDALVAARPGGEVEAYRLRVSSLDPRGGEVKLQVDDPKVGTGSDSRLPDGLPLAAAKDGAPAAWAFAERGPSTWTLGGAPAWVCPTLGGGCALSARSVHAAGGDGLVVVGVEGTLQGERIRLGRAPVALSAMGPIAVDLPANKGPVVAVVRSADGQPGVRITPKLTGYALSPEPVRMDVGRGSAVAVHLGGDASSAVLWQHGAKDAALRASAHPLLPPESGSWSMGAHAGALRPGQSLRIKLPKPGLSVELALGAEGIVVFDGPDGQSVRWADGEARSVHAAEVGQTLWLLNPSHEPVRWSAVVSEGSAAPRSVAAGAPAEGRAARVSDLRIAVPAGPGHLGLEGAIEHAWYLRADGAVLAAAGAEVGPGGALSVRQRPGWWVAWVDAPGADGPWGAREKGKAETISGSVAWAVEGERARAELKADGPRLLVVDLPGPSLARFAPSSVGAGSPTTVVREQGGTAWWWAPSGLGELSVRAPAGQRLVGPIGVKLHPIVAIQEGLGPDTLLAPGDAAVFAFSVERAGPIGVGVRADAERVRATLLTSTGEVLGEGPVQAHELAEGTYVLVLDLPNDAAPVRARPAVVGLDLPPDTPPEEVIRQYQRSASSVESPVASEESSP